MQKAFIARTRRFGRHVFMDGPLPTLTAISPCTPFGPGIIRGGKFLPISFQSVGRRLSLPVCGGATLRGRSLDQHRRSATGCGSRLTKYSVFPAKGFGRRLALYVAAACEPGVELSRRPGPAKVADAGATSCCDAGSQMLVKPDLRDGSMLRKR
jgi:hypothetical protein